MDDPTYESIFKPVIVKVMEHFQPSVVVMCCGADSLSGDRVGCWNLSIKGHAAVRMSSARPHVATCSDYHFCMLADCSQHSGLRR